MTQQLLLKIAPDWTPTLENFIAGRNVELLSALRAALAGQGGERCFYLWGEAGAGKSHLLQAVAAAAGSAGLAAAYGAGKVPEGAPVIAVDDADTLDEGAQISLFETYNRIRETGGMLVASGKAAPAHLALRDDLRTRLGWGMVFQVHGLNDAEKAEALVKHAHARGFDLPPEVTQYLLRHGRRNLPSLIAVLDALDEHCLRLKRGASVPLLREVLQTNLDFNPPPA